MTVLTHPCPTASRVSVAVRGVRQQKQTRLVKTVKIQETGRHAHPGQDRRFPGCGDTLKALVSFVSILGGDQCNLALGSPSTGSPAGRTPLLLKRRDGSMYSQAYLRTTRPAKPENWRIGPSVAVRDRGHCKSVCGKRMGP